jgi:small subunit ribosomal protein S13
MLVVFGVTLPREKKVLYALPELYGIGLTTSRRICNELGLPPQLRIADLTDAQQYEIAKKLKEDLVLEGSLRETIKADFQRYMTNGSVRGFRHRNSLPVRGQRTHSNAKTVRRTLSGRVRVNKA